MKQHFCKLSGIAISTLVHVGLAAVLLPVLFAKETKPEEPPVLPLELSMFQPKAPEPAPQPVAQVAPEPPPPPPPPQPKPKPAAKPKEQPKEKPKPKPEKPVEKPIPKPVEKPIPKPPERDLEKERREEWQRQQLEQQRREQELAEQRRREWEAQQARERAEREARQRAEREAAARAAAQAQNEVPVITNPRYRSPPRPPEYPRRAQEAGIEGTVIVRARVNANGNVSDASVQQSSGNASLDAAALKAVRGWAFVPASRNGQNMDSIVQVPVHFKLN